MEREVSSTVSLAVALIALGLLISIIWNTVMVGSQMEKSAGGAIGDVKNEISVNYVTSLAKGEADNEMPTATAYNIFETYGRTITDTVCGIDGAHRNLMKEHSDLRDHLTGRVSVQLVETNGSNTYVAFIHRHDCTWYTGNCICIKNQLVNTEFNKLKTKYGIANTGW